MLRIFLASVSAVVLLLGFAASTWYLTHPESWNAWSLASLLSLDDDSGTAPVAIGARFVPPEAMRPETIAVPSVAQADADGIKEEIAAGACVLPDTVSVTSRQGALIYSWRDEKGQLNFSDKPPRSPAIQARTTSYWLDPEYFNLDIEYRGANAIADFQRELAQDVTGIYKIVANLVGENYLRKVDLNIVIYPDRATYVQYANSKNPPM